MTETEYAVVDIGSNSLRLMQGLLSDGQWRFYPKRMATTRLARGLAETGHLWSDGIANSLPPKGERPNGSFTQWSVTVHQNQVITVVSLLLLSFGQLKSFSERMFL